MPVLETTNLTIRFGGLTAVSNFNVCLEEGELVGLIGPNGAGKTTVFNMLTGVYRPSEGAVIFCKEQVCSASKALQPCQITMKGIARTFQNIRLFKELSVLDNVKVAYHQNVKLVSSQRFYTPSSMLQKNWKLRKRPLNF